MAALAMAAVADVASASEDAPIFDVRAWGVDDGLPGTHVNGAIQDDDGFLWLATLTGLVRFDGNTFEVIDEVGAPSSWPDRERWSLPSNRLVAIHRGPTGRIWVGTEQGHLLEVGPDGVELIAEPPYPGGAINIIAEDRDGVVWLTRSGDVRLPDRAMLWRFDGAALRPRRDLDALWLDVAGLDETVWIRPVDDRAPVELGARMLAVSRDAEGDVWGMMAYGHLIRLRDRWTDPVGPSIPGGNEAIARTLFTRETQEYTEVFARPEATGGWRVVNQRVFNRLEHSFWLIDSRGLLWTTLFRAGDSREYILQAHRRGRVEPIFEIPLHTFPREMFEDREGNIWVSTLTRGLLRIRESPLRLWTPADGVPLPGAVGGMADGSLLLDEAPQGRCQPLYRFDGVEATPVREGCGWMFEDRRGVRWTFRDETLIGRIGTASTRIPTRGDWAVEDPFRDGVLWVRERLRLLRIATRIDGDSVAPTLEARVTGSWDLSANRALVFDGPETLWIGADHGLLRLRNDELEAFGRVDGLPSENVRAIRLAPDGALWLGTYGGGLVHFEPDVEGDGATVFDVGRGLPENVVSSLTEDSHGGLWFAGNRGVHRIDVAQLDRALEDPSLRLDVLSFDGRSLRGTALSDATAAARVPNLETTGRPAHLDTRGRIWFATFAGLLRVDPALLEIRARQAPTALVTGLRAGEQVADSGETVRIAPESVREATFAVTGIHLSDPSSVRLRARLHPYDSDWVDVGVERELRYRQLPPGDYRFEVQARTPLVDWRSGRSGVTLLVAPRFHETLLFFALLALLVASAVVAGWRFSTSQVRQRAARLEAAVAARTSELAAERDVVSRQASRLGELAEARARFLAAISHELRTPLTLIVGPLRDLLDGRRAVLPEALRDDVATSMRNADRLRRLTDRLLEVARSDGALTRLQAVERDFVTFTREVVDELQPLAAQTGSTLRARLPDQRVPLWFDQLHLETVILNLAANALRHCPAGTRVVVSVEPPSSVDDVVRLTVRDDGPGIRAEDLPHLFERFTRGSGERLGAVDGFGLGLALVRDVVERHGGLIEVESVPAQDARSGAGGAGGLSGTTFTVTLRCGRNHLRPTDLATPDELAAANLVARPARRRRSTVVDQLEFGDRDLGESEATPTDAAPEDLGFEVSEPSDEAAVDCTTVLVVDDNAELRALVSRQLADRYRVLEAEDGGAALAQLAETLPDLVLTDVMMPGVDGFELCRAIRADPEIDTVPVVFLSARASAESRVEGLEGGADAYLTKPFDPAELRATVDGLIASRRRLRGRFAAKVRSGEIEVVVPGTRAAQADGPDVAESSLGPSSTAEDPSRVVRADDRRYCERLETSLVIHLHDEDFGVDQLAEAMAQSRVTLYRHVKRLYDTTPSDLLRSTRLEQAARLLERGEGSVSEIGYAVGFKSTSHFSNAFLERFGRRPSKVGSSDLPR